MKTKKSVIAVIFFLIVLFLYALYVILPKLIISPNEADNANSLVKNEMVETTLEWGRLTAIPDSKTNFDIITEGGFFTRAFRSSFNLPKNDLEKWIKSSPGLSDAEIEIISNTKTKYIIEPGGGAQYAEAIIDTEKCFVEIYVYWS